MTAKFIRCLDALEELKSEFHQTSNKFFFQQRFVTSSDLRAHEAKVGACLSILREIYPNLSEPKAQQVAG